MGGLTPANIAIFTRVILGTKPAPRKAGKRQSKDRLHKGTWRTCPVCNPVEYTYWLKQEARAKGRRR